MKDKNIQYIALNLYQVRFFSNIKPEKSEGKGECEALAHTTIESENAWFVWSVCHLLEREVRKLAAAACSAECG